MHDFFTIERIKQPAVAAVALIAIAFLAYFLFVGVPGSSSNSADVDIPLTPEQKRAMMESLEQSTDTHGRSMDEAREAQGLTPERRLEIINGTGL